MIWNIVVVVAGFCGQFPSRVKVKIIGSTANSATPHHIQIIN